MKGETSAPQEGMTRDKVINLAREYHERHEQEIAKHFVLGELLHLSQFDAVLLLYDTEGHLDDAGSFGTNLICAPASLTGRPTTVLAVVASGKALGTLMHELTHAHIGHSPLCRWAKRKKATEPAYSEEEVCALMEHHLPSMISDLLVLTSFIAGEPGFNGILHQLEASMDAEALHIMRDFNVPHQTGFTPHRKVKQSKFGRPSSENPQD